MAIGERKAHSYQQWNIAQYIFQEKNLAILLGFCVFINILINPINQKSTFQGNGHLAKERMRQGMGHMVLMAKSPQCCNLSSIS